MNRETFSPAFDSAYRTSVPAWLRTAGVLLGGSVFLAICSHISIPLWFTPVPLTLQPFGVLLLGLLLSPRLAGGALAAYLLEGAAGLPVFAPGVGVGVAHLLGPTGGYLLAYPAAAFLIAAMWQRSSSRFGWALVSAACGDLLIFGCGALWLAGRTHLSFSAAMASAVMPFLPGDALKVATAAGLATGWRHLRK